MLICTKGIVKALDWRPGIPKGLLTASTTVGGYRIWQFDNGAVHLEYHYRGFGGPKGDNSFFRLTSVEEAKAKAQAHHETMVLPCLVPHPIYHAI